jgi:hypothetical protein
MPNIYVERELELEKSADEVWAYLADFRNAMTMNQFHVAVDCDRADVAHAKVGLVVPILHRMFGAEHYRLGRITQFTDYAFAWGERTDDGSYDPFPHSTGWSVSEIDDTTCLVRTWLRGLPRGPESDDSMAVSQAPPANPMNFSAVLDADLADLAVAVGARPSRTPEMIPEKAEALRWLASTWPAGITEAIGDPAAPESGPSSGSRA